MEKLKLKPFSKNSSAFCLNSSAFIFASYLLSFHKTKRTPNGVLFVLANKSYAPRAPFCGAKRREGRFRALAVREKARKKEWQPSQNASKTLFAKRDAQTATGTFPSARGARKSEEKEVAAVAERKQTPLRSAMRKRQQ